MSGAAEICSKSLEICSKSPEICSRLMFGAAEICSKSPEIGSKSPEICSRLMSGVAEICSKSIEICSKLMSGTAVCGRQINAKSTEVYQAARNICASARRILRSNKCPVMPETDLESHADCRNIVPKSHKTRYNEMRSHFSVFERTCDKTTGLPHGSLEASTKSTLASLKLWLQSERWGQDWWF